MGVGGHPGPLLEAAVPPVGLMVFSPRFDTVHNPNPHMVATSATARTGTRFHVTGRIVQNLRPTLENNFGMGDTCGLVCKAVMLEVQEVVWGLDPVMYLWI